MPVVHQEGVRDAGSGWEKMSRFLTKYWAKLEGSVGGAVITRVGGRGQPRGDDLCSSTLLSPRDTFASRSPLLGRCPVRVNGVGQDLPKKGNPSTAVMCREMHVEQYRQNKRRHHQQLVCPPPRCRRAHAASHVNETVPQPSRGLQEGEGLRSRYKVSYLKGELAWRSISSVTARQLSSLWQTSGAESATRFSSLLAAPPPGPSTTRTSKAPNERIISWPRPAGR